MSPGIIDGAGLFFHTMFWSRLAYILPKPKFFDAADLLAKIYWKKLKFLAIFIKLSK